MYSNILTATRDLLRSLPEVSVGGWSVVIRDRPAWIPLQDTLPAIVVAPRADLATRPVKMLFGNVEWLGYLTFIGAFIDDRSQDQVHLFRRLDIHEVIRLRLHQPGILGLASSGEFDVNHDATGAGGEPPPANVEGTWQSYERICSGRRHIPAV